MADKCESPRKSRRGGDGPIIQVRDLSIGYGDTVIMQDLNFDIQRGEVFVILGGSGCGKSTLLKTMIGLIEPKSGSIIIDGDNIVDADEKTRMRILRKIGVTYQSGALFGSMTLLENLRLPMEEFTDLPEDTMDLMGRMKLSLVGLLGYEHHMPSELSGGMQKRAAMARAMALDPMMIFLDEPSAGLDPITSAGLDQLILTLRDSLGITFIIVSHELPSIYTIADRVIMLEKRTRGIVAEGKPADLRDNSDNPLVRRFFNREPD